jgi:hypothetical protein
VLSLLISVAPSPLIVKTGGVFYQATPKNLKLDITVVRINRAGEACNARPCYNCLNMMKAVGIRRVHYSVSPTELVCENVKDMISIQASTVSKHVEKINGTCDVVDDENPHKFYEYLLKKNFPTSIKRYNLDSFIQYNLSNDLPTYKVKIVGKNDKQVVWILNTNEQVVIKASVIP